MWQQPGSIVATQITFSPLYIDQYLSVIILGNKDLFFFSLRFPHYSSQSSSNLALRKELDVWEFLTKTLISPTLTIIELNVLAMLFEIILFYEW